MDLEIWQLALLSALGIVAGTLNVIAGGGSLLTLPAMIFMGMPAPVANGTNRVAILAQNISAVSGFKSKGYSDFKLSLSLALASVPGAVLGAHVGSIIRSALFNTILGIVMIAVVIWMAVKDAHKRKRPDSTPPQTHELTRQRLIWGHVGMVVVGFYGGFIQAGVGFLLMAVLSNVMRLDLVRVNMHKVFIVGSFTLAALIVYILHGNVWWLPGICLAAGNSIGGWIGAHLTVTKGEGFIRAVLYCALVAMAIKLLAG